ncbi:MAG: hypothetical protein HYZ53_19355 [Planctomycetes bacterium]|nr:hypothetical protein [Planctomycetota bacterium]
MPKTKTGEGGTAVLEPKARGLSINETLALACDLEDLADALTRLKPDARTRKIVARLRALSEDLEDRADVQLAREALKETGSIAWETVKKELGL